jgi:hypothetical protein
LITAVLDRIAEITEELRDDETIPDPIRMGELEIFEKFTIQHGRRWDGYLGHKGPDPFDLEIPDDFRQMAREVAAWLKDKPVEELTTSNPYDTNGGWPMLFPGPGPKMVGAALTGTASPWQDIVSASILTAQNLSLVEAGVQAFALAYRSGPFYKQAPDWFFNFPNDTWYANRTVAGAWPRARHIFMVSFTEIARMTPVWQQAYGRLSNVPIWDRTGDNDVTRVRAAAERGMYIVESDYSGYDQSIHPKLLELIASDVLAELSDADSARAWLGWQQRPVLTPPWVPDQRIIKAWTLATKDIDLSKYEGKKAGPTGADAFSIVGGFGGLSSGDKLTSWFGATLNFIVITWALRRLKIFSDPIGSYERGEWDVLIQGDDTMLMTTSPIDTDAWSETIAEVGLKVTILNGRRFLMKHMTDDGHAYAVGGRVVQNTLSPEYPHTKKPALGLNYLALADRLSSGLYPGIAKYVWRCLELIEWIEPILRHLGWPTSVPTAMEVASYIKVVHASKIAEAVKMQARMKDFSVQAAVRDAPYSPSAAGLVKAIEALAPDALAVSEAVSKAFNNAVLDITHRNDNSSTFEIAAKSSSMAYELLRIRESKEFKGIQAEERDLVTIHRLVELHRKG